MCNYAECCYTENSTLFIVLLNVIVLRVIILRDVAPNANATITLVYLIFVMKDGVILLESFSTALLVVPKKPLQVFSTNNSNEVDI
jgi:hypothetical protein